jgi:hypothetical protein
MDPVAWVKFNPVPMEGNLGPVTTRKVSEQETEGYSVEEIVDLAW